MDMGRHIIGNKWKIVVFILFLWIFKVIVWQPYFSDPNGPIIHAGEAIGRVITRRVDGGWFIEDDVCYEKTEDFVLAHLTKPPNTPIYVYPEIIDEYISADIIHTGGYEIYNIVRLLDYMKAFPEAVFLDIGAYVGTYSITMAALGYNVVAVECLRSSVARLCASVKEAKVSNRIIMVHNALADDRKKANLKTEQGNIGMTYITEDKSLVNDSVDAILLDDLLEIFPFKQVIMKMDAHEHEDIILNGAHSFFRQVRVEALLMEFIHHKADKYADDGKFIVNFLDNHGLEPDVPDDIKHIYKSWYTSEILFKRKK